jgi:putative transcriptional regulator
MHWNLRMVAAQRGIWRSSDLRRLLSDAGLAISAGKMSYLWSGRPISIRLDDLEVICQVLDCEPSELLLRDQPAQARPADAATEAAASPPAPASIRPAGRRGGRTPPPV